MHSIMFQMSTKDMVGHLVLGLQNEFQPKDAIAMEQILYLQLNPTNQDLAQVNFSFQE